MERAKQPAVGSSSSSSSFAMELFGPKESSKSSTSAPGHFGTIFGPPSSSMVPKKESFAGHNYVSAKDGGTPADHNKSKNNNKNEYYKKNNGHENGKVEPCYFNSSIYYGGQEVYSPPNPKNSPPNNLMKKDGEDPNESNPSCASRGNWWQGSLYY